MATGEIEKWREWKKQNPDYPLTAAPCGQWCKKVKGRTHYFGPLRDPDAALAEWLRDKDYLLAGMEPPALPNGTTVEGLLDMFLEACDKRISIGEMTDRGKASYEALRGIFRSAGVHRVPAKQVTPHHFARLRRAIADGRKLRTQVNCIVNTRTIFKWAAENEYIESVRYGSEFKSPPAEKIEAEQEETNRFIDRGAILDVLSRADQRMRVAVLLGINCAFGPGDSVAVTLDRLHLDAEIPHHDFRRTKNSRRRAAALWPETVKAIRRYMDGDRRPKRDGEQRLLLSDGRAMPETGDVILNNEFRAVLDEIGQRRHWVGIGSLRHTYATVIDRHLDQSMIDLTMGHVGQGLRRRVYKQMDLDELHRLQSVATVVHDWLFVPTIG